MKEDELVCYVDFNDYVVFVKKESVRKELIDDETNPS